MLSINISISFHIFILIKLIFKPQKNNNGFIITFIVSEEEHIIIFFFNSRIKLIKTKIWKLKLSFILLLNYHDQIFWIFISIVLFSVGIIKCVLSFSFFFQVTEINGRKLKVVLKFIFYKKIEGSIKYVICMYCAE